MLVVFTAMKVSVHKSVSGLGMWNVKGTSGTQDGFMASVQSWEIACLHNISECVQGMQISKSMYQTLQIGIAYTELCSYMYIIDMQRKSN